MGIPFILYDRTRDGAECEEREKKEVWWMNQRFYSLCVLFFRIHLVAACVLWDHRSLNLLYTSSPKVFSVIKFAFLSFFLIHSSFCLFSVLHASFSVQCLYGDCEISIQKNFMMFVCFHLNRFFWFVNWFLLRCRLPFFSLLRFSSPHICVLWKSHTFVWIGACTWLNDATELNYVIIFNIRG